MKSGFRAFESAVAAPALPAQSKNPGVLGVLAAGFARRF
jgi:hypothetical protein